MRSRHFLFILGAIWGCIIPIGWLFWRAYSSRQAWWDAWLHHEFHDHSALYWVMGVICVVIFSSLGYFIGQQNDQWIQESDLMRDSNLELVQQASTDPLTNLFNLRAFNDRLQSELENSYQTPLTCFLIDIDHFKKINDTYGHPFGDMVLSTIAHVLKRAVRPMDAVGRLGGEEFAIILPGLPKDRAFAVAERIRLAIQEEPIYFDEKKIKVTISIGVITYPNDGPGEKSALLQSADEALYKAKKSGRNKVVLWENSSKSNTPESSQAA